VVLITTGVEKMPKPTATHWEGDTQEIPVRPLTVAGMCSLCQVRPTFVVTSTVSTPAAKQATVDGHETESS
jgi:hypothetical protein